MARTILIVDPDPDRASVLATNLSSLGCKTLRVAELRPEPCDYSCDFDAMFVEVGAFDAALCAALRDRGDHKPVIVVAEIATIDQAARTIEMGASLYLLRPFDREHLRVALERASARIVLGGTAAASKPPRSQGTSVHPTILGAHPKMTAMIAQARKASRCEANVLLFGESGTGKELLAHAIHAESRRAKHPFIPVDCAAIPENLLEAELFGYEKGAFTGAALAKPGLLEAANHGTIFLDEIGELPLSLQPKLLRALQGRQHRRVGGLRFIDFDVRIISATNRDLRELVASSRFREDLFYRLQVLPIRLPPLRERREDVKILAEHFLAQFGAEHRPPIRALRPEVLAALQNYPWPGNVRELRNAIEYACAVADDKSIGLSDLPVTIASDSRVPHDAPGSVALDPNLKTARARFEMEYVSELLRRHNGNVSAAAKAAGVDRKTLYYILNKHRIARGRDASAHHPRLRVVKI